jgi:large subunit ribosomal protein L30e
MLTDIIQDAIQHKKIIIGYKKVTKAIKNDIPKLVVLAENIPEEMKKEIEHSAKVLNIKVEIIDKSSVELGTLCGKPFPVAALAIRD